jgi:hypothetical protein
LESSRRESVVWPAWRRPASTVIVPSAASTHSKHSFRSSTSSWSTTVLSAPVRGLDIHLAGRGDATARLPRVQARRPVVDQLPPDSAPPKSDS